MGWQLVTTSDKLSPDTPFAFSVDDQKLALFQVGDQYHVLENICPHAYALLTDGFVDEETVECPLHGAPFHIPTGRCLGPPAEKDLKTYPVKVENDQIFVEL